VAGGIIAGAAAAADVALLRAAAGCQGSDELCALLAGSLPAGQGHS
jgi:hypothetical protein